MLNQVNYKPAWWLPGPHLQTLWPALLRRPRKLNTIKERLELADGDFLDLVWIGSSNGHVPIVIILHGLNGSVESPYVNGMLNAIEQHGWRAVLMHFRGCSGQPNRLDRSYHSGETGDLNTLIRELIKRGQNVTLFIIGYSLGGNVLLKALGEGLPANVQAAVAVSVPFELNKTADHLNQGFSKIYQWRLVSGLIAAYKSKFKNRFNMLRVPNLAQIKTFWQFDDAITAPLHGFNSAADYYQKSSSRQYLASIKIPTLIIHAYNDPFTHPDSLPTSQEVAPSVTLEITKYGGHVGFIAGNLPWKPVYWLEQKIIGYLANH